MIQKVPFDFTSLKSYRKFIATFDEIDLDTEEESNDELMKNPIEDLLNFVDKDLDIFQSLPERKSIAVNSKTDRQKKKCVNELKKRIDSVAVKKDQPSDERSSCERALETSSEKESGLVKSEPHVTEPSVPSSGEEEGTHGEEEEEEEGWATLLVYSCKECEVRVLEQDRVRHEQEQHEGEARGGPGGPLQYQCLICISNIDWSLAAIRTHLASHQRSLADYRNQFEEPIPLQIKKQTEMLKKELEKKASKAQSRPSNVKCGDCGKKYTTNFALQRHRKTEHRRAQRKIKQEKKDSEDSNGGYHNCKSCKFKSNRRGALTFHVSKYHDDSEKLECCGQTLSSRWSLFVHLHAKHSEERELFNKHQIWPGLDKYI